MRINNKELTLKTAENLLKNRTQSFLENIKYCVIDNKKTRNWPAAYPAILYCFAMIDMLGALYDGNATKNSHPSKQSEKYMTEIMRYPKDMVHLLQEVFRHKLVHLAQPNSKTKGNDGKWYSWAYSLSDRKAHLKCQDLPDGTSIFSISIWSLSEDIKNSVPDYLDRLKNKPNLPDKFRKAYKEMICA